MRKPKDIKIGNYTLEEILMRHKHWINQDCENWKDMCADLRDADLRYANMCYANMRYANMRDVNMRDADLRYANMCYANMRDVNMRDADLRYANLSYADLRYADLRDADLSYADLRDANLSYADLRDANLSYANLSYADLRDADLRYANMCYAKMCDADRLRKGIKLSEPIIGWKKCKNNVLVKLEIPRGAIVFSINNKKCRTDKAKVLEIIGADRAYSNNKFFSYYVGDIIEVFNFNCEYNVECAEGIHFFRTRKEAEDY